MFPEKSSFCEWQVLARVGHSWLTDEQTAQFNLKTVAGLLHDQYLIKTRSSWIFFTFVKNHVWNNKKNLYVISFVTKWNGHHRQSAFWLPWDPLPVTFLIFHTNQHKSFQIPDLPENLNCHNSYSFISFSENKFCSIFNCSWISEWSHFW